MVHFRARLRLWQTLLPHLRPSISLHTIIIFIVAIFSAPRYRWCVCVSEAGVCGKANDLTEMRARETPGTGSELPLDTGVHP